ncbi:unnamed protein product [Cuscuta campestris]|uniref:Uncharacterized protein n=1 Tax=Cuscuta campestris TaxID=132261 RepID=A0A484LGU3_9ASTE|nr:unnamed protein product [Cuscuta campestris]
MGKQNPRVLSNSPGKNDAEQEQENRLDDDDDDDDDEALSLSDLPNDQQENQFKKEPPVPGDESEQGEFDFCSLAGSMKESEMCLADELFFRGKILPLRRHSVSADSASAALRCNSMERCRSATSASSRSSSTRSHQSSSSATSSAAASGKPPRSWNRFQFSQPSPTPHIRLPKASSRGPTASSNGHPRSSSSSALWTLFRVGLVTMPEFGSRSFTRVTSRDKSDHDNNNNNNNRSKVVRSVSSGGSVDSSRSNAVTKKLKQIFVHKNMAFFETCKCSVNSVENVPLRSDINGEEDKKKKKKKKDRVVSGKQSMSRIRTFEWLKQLSLDGDAATEHRVDRNVNH